MMSRQKTQRWNWMALFSVATSMHMSCGFEYIFLRRFVPVMLVESDVAEWYLRRSVSVVLIHMLHQGVDDSDQCVPIGFSSTATTGSVVVR